MLSIALSVSFLLHLSITTAATTTPPYTPTDYILLDCGSSSNTSFPDGRDWQADANPDYLPSNAETISITSQASTQYPSITQKVPYMTARIFQSQFTYTFSGLSTGPKFIRLYFYPSTYSTFNKADSFFSVIANSHTLLSNFSAHLTVSSMPRAPATLVKEYIIHINEEQQLSITFLPSPNSYAFVNGIELVSIPDKLYYPGNDVVFQVVGQTNTGLNIRNQTAFETAYRLNVGGGDVPVTEDTGMFRAWTPDDDYILGAAKGLTDQGKNVTVNYSTLDAPPYTAPEIVYTTARFMSRNVSLRYNMTWLFLVDSGFYYLLRLHFCEFFLEIREESDRVFTIFINNRTAELEADVITWGNGPQVAVKRDYIAHVVDPDGHQSKQYLWLEMHPNHVTTLSRYDNALLNGLEIFKLSNSSDSLAAPNPLPVSSPTTPEPSTVLRKKKSKSWPLILAVTGAVVLVISFVGFLIFRRRKRVKDSATSATKSLWGPLSKNSRSTKTSGSGSTLPSDLCRHFSIEEIRSATGNFDDNFVIGVGGFGNVYKGFMDNGTTEVAIKRLNPSSNQGLREFLTEIEMLSKLRHLHLVSLIGYCDDNGEMILVYDYMARGTLRNHLYKTENPPLPWKQRLQICIGAAKGLHYLHTSANHMIIHRDVKSTNILLDEKWVAKVSDFGLSKMGPIVGTHTHVSTVVKGSFGYVDPEYYRRQQLTEKSDVYSFGVVLFEVLCARPAIIPNLPKEQANLAEWARQSYRKGTLYQILDPNLEDEIAPESLDKYVEIAFSCLKDKGIERPAMNDVVWSLEFALQLEEIAEKRGFKMGAIDSNASPSLPLILHEEATTTNDDLFSRSGDAASSRSKSSVHFKSGSDGFKSETVFSEMMNPSAR